MIGTSECNNEQMQMDASSMVSNRKGEFQFQSFAKECIRICSLPCRENGVKTSSKSNKREQSAKMLSRQYHYQDKETVEYNGIQKETVGFIKSKKKHGLNSHYHIRADPMLGVGYVAVRRIPCYCKGCIDKLKIKWSSIHDIFHQKRYLGDNPNCIYWNILGSYNNWRIVKCIDVTKSLSNEKKEILRVKKTATQHMSSYISQNIMVGEYAAISTVDKKADSGYYLVKWTGEPYTLQEQFQNENEEIFQCGEVVCDAEYLNSFAGKKQWFTPYRNTDNGRTLIRLTTVIATDINICPICDIRDKLGWSKSLLKNAIALKAVFVTEKSHDEVLETMFAREELDHNESIEMDLGDSSGEDDSDDE